MSEKETTLCRQNKANKDDDEPLIRKNSSKQTVEQHC